MWSQPWGTFFMSDEKKVSSKNMLEKIMTVIKVESRFLSEAIMDSSGTRIFKQEIEEAKANLKLAKSALTSEMANELQSSRRVKILTQKASQQESLIVDALAQNNEKLAFNLATALVDLEQDRDAQLVIQRTHDLHLGHLKRQMELAERSLKDLERQLAMVNTTDRIQKATEVITKRFDTADAKMLSAKKTLDRIRKQQQQRDEQYLIEDNLLESGEDKSDIKVEKGSATDVLKRLVDKD